MSKKLSVFFMAVVFFSFSRFAFANLVINEIMYDVQGTDTDHEWVEIFNTSSTDNVDISGWKFNDGANHNLNQPPAGGGQGSFLIPPLGYAVLAAKATTFLTDHSGFSGTVIDTVMSLNNSGATLKILDQSNNMVDNVTYTSSQGASGDGNSLQKISGSWVGFLPTPGITNTVASSGNNIALGSLVSPEEISKLSSTSVSNTEIKNKEDNKIKIDFKGNNFAFKGIPIDFQVMTFGKNKEILNFGKYFLNFGDGDSKEIKINNINNLDKISHIYYYPGDYVLTLEYYQNPYTNTPDAIYKNNINVVLPDIYILKIGDEKDFFIELINNTKYDADISNWSINSLNKTFLIPKNTIINSKKTIIFSPKITNFSFTDKNNLKLFNSQGEEMYDNSLFLNISDKNQINKDIKESNTNQINESKEEIINLNNKLDTNDNILPSKKDNLNSNLSATAINTTEQNFNNKFIFIAVCVLIFLGSGLVYFIRSKKNKKSELDDFNILEE